MKGAFKNTLKEDGLPALLWQHIQKEVIGAYTEVREDSHGLYVKGKFTKGVQRGDEALLLLRDNALKGLSIGFQTKKSERDEDTDERRLLEVKLFEISLVTHPANPQAQVTSVKGDNIKSERELERLLRDGGMPNGFAKLVVRHGFKGAMTIVNRRDVGDGGEDLAKALRRAASILTNTHGVTPHDEPSGSKTGGR